MAHINTRYVVKSTIKMENGGIGLFFTFAGFETWFAEPHKTINFVIPAGPGSSPGGIQFHALSGFRVKTEKGIIQVSFCEGKRTTNSCFAVQREYEARKLLTFAP